MKPLKLTMQAFGSFKDKTTLDFTKIKPSRLFLIQGRTGSGKTTILDAITFALYGGASGAYERDYRCELADEGVLTEVKFTFAENGKIYTILRRPRQSYITRRKTKGFHPTYVTLHDDSNDRDIPLERSSKEIEKLVGLSKDQFTQVAILPQGRFIDILNADPDKRENLLRSLLKTDAYARLALNLKTEATDLEHKVKAREDAIADALEHIGLKTEIDLGHEEKERAKQYEALKALEESALKEKDDATARFSKAEVIVKHFKTLEEAEAAYQKIIARKDVMARQADTVTLLKKVQVVLPARARLDGSTQHLTSFTQSLVKAQDARAKLAEIYGSEEHLSQAYASDHDALEENASLRAKNEQALKLVCDLVKEKEASARAEETLASSKRTKDKETKEIEDLKERIVSLEKEIALENTLAKENTDLALLKHTLEEERSHIKEKEDKTIEIERVKTELDSAKSALAFAQKELKFEENERDRKRYIYELTASFRLASTLAEGVPCPVCGSVHHPSPALAPGETVSEDDLKQVEGIIKKLTKDQNVKQDALSRLEAKLTEKNKVLEALPNVSVKEHDDKENDYTKRKKAYDKAILQVSKAKETLAQLRKSLEAKKESLEKCKIQISESKQALRLHQEQIEQLKSSLSSQADEKELLKQKQALLDEKERLDQSLASSKDAQEKYKSLDGEIKTYEEELKKAQKEFNEAEQNWEKVSSDNGISKEECDREAPKLKQLPDLENTLTLYQKDLAKTEEALRVAKDACENETPPDMAHLSSAKEKADQKYEEAKKATDDARGKLDEIKRTKEFIDEKNKGLSELETRYNLTKRLADLANGTLAGTVKISLERFVLMQQLDVMIAHANPKLDRFTDGAYRLQRKEAGAASARGLELEVVSRLSGEPRSIASLSGGESFVAALALALGLSEAVTAANGAVAIDALFIDEGFGSLDDQMIENAVTTLSTLEDTNRMIGIISHVEELREYLLSGIKVTKDSHGSSHLEVYGRDE